MGENDVLEIDELSNEGTGVDNNTVPGEDNVENGVTETQGEEAIEVNDTSEEVTKEDTEVSEEVIKEDTEVSEEVTKEDTEVSEEVTIEDLQETFSTDELLTSDEFNTAMEELIALQEVQIEGLQYMYSSQLFCIGVLAVLIVCIILHKVLKIFL